MGRGSTDDFKAVKLPGVTVSRRTLVITHLSKPTERSTPSDPVTPWAPVTTMNQHWLISCHSTRGRQRVTAGPRGVELALPAPFSLLSGLPSAIKTMDYRIESPKDSAAVTSCLTGRAASSGPCPARPPSSHAPEKPRRLSLTQPGLGLRPAMASEKHFFKWKM